MAFGGEKACNFAGGLAVAAQRMHASGEPAGTIAATLGVSRATVYRVLSTTES
jgi:hypothetical protein